MSTEENDVQEIKISAQEGPQMDFMSSQADILIYGGAAGGGKSAGLLIDPLRHLNNKPFRGVIFRRESPMITNPGGLWDESASFYGPCFARPNRSLLEWRFPSGMKIKFAHLYLEEDKYAWQGAQFSYLGMDELTHFSEDQFFYLLSRLRSLSGVPGYARATCNPDPDSWVRKFIAWWIDDQTGYPIQERSGVLRWFIRVDDTIVWADTKEELLEKYGIKGRADQKVYPKSVTFIPAKLEDNKILMEKDPSYQANIMAQNKVDRERLGGGNWNIRPAAGLLFKKSYFKIIRREELPSKRKIIRYWDRAATEQDDKKAKDPDYTVGLKMSKDDKGTYYIEHVERLRGTPATVETTIKNIASQDTKDVDIGIEVDPGSAGKFEADFYVKALVGYVVRLNPAKEDKVKRAGPLSTQAEHGNVVLVEGTWNDAYLDEMEAFPTPSVHDDQVDASSGAFKLLTQGGSGYFNEGFAQNGGQREQRDW